MSSAPPLSREELHRRIHAFPRWHYQFDLAGEVTPVFRPQNVNRHRQRRGYFFEPLVRLLGGSLAGKRVLDLGCNAGYWSLASVEARCDAVVGIDARRMHVEQAELVFTASRVEANRYRFLQGDVLRLPIDELGSFDVALCLGLLYHVNQPMQLLELCARASTDVLVIDTDISRDSRSILEVAFDDTSDPRNAVESPIVFFPSAAAVMEMVRSLGFHGVVLAPRFTDYTGCEDFESGRRRAFLCAKKTDLSSLAPLAERSF